MEKELFNAMEIDALGEMMNISLGSSATAVSNMLDHRVDITTPKVTVIKTEDFALGELDPAVGVEIKYVEGLEGSNIMLLHRNDVKVIVDILMGMETPDEEFELNELTISAVCEVMNQMMGASATALSDFLGFPVNISTPQSFELHNLEEFKAEHFPVGADTVVVVRFSLRIEDALESEFMNVMSVELAKELLKGLGLSDDEEEEAPAPAPAAEPASSGGGDRMLTQEEIEKLMMGGGADEPPAPEPSGGGDRKLTQEEIERLMMGGAAEEAPPPPPPSGGGDRKLTQEEIEAMMMGAAASAPPPPPPPPPSGGGDRKLTQEEIEAMMMGAAASAPPPPPPPPPAPTPAPTPAPAPAPQAAPQGAPQMPPQGAANGAQMPPYMMYPPMPQGENGQFPGYMGYPPMFYPPYPYPPQPPQEEKKAEPKVINTQPVPMHQMSAAESLGKEQAENLDLIMEVPLQVSVEIGRTQRKVHDILEFAKGSLVVLDKLAGDQVDLFVNGKCIAKGDVVVIDDNFGVRITEIIQNAGLPQPEEKKKK